MSAGNGPGTILSWIQAGKTRIRSTWTWSSCVCVGAAAWRSGSPGDPAAGAGKEGEGRGAVGNVRPVEAGKTGKRATNLAQICFQEEGNSPDPEAPGSAGFSCLAFPRGLEPSIPEADGLPGVGAMLGGGIPTGIRLLSC